MLRSVLLNATRNVTAAIRDSELIEGYREARGAKPGRTSSRLFVAVHKFALLAADFGTAEHAILEILGLNDLVDPEWAFSVFAQQSEDARPLHLMADMNWNITFASNHLPKLMQLLENEATRWEHVKESEADEPKSLNLLQLILIEGERESSTPTRVVDAIASIDTLYNVVVRIHDLPQNTLSVVGCDSGSDKKFDFLGIADAINGVKEIILSVWDRVVFHRERQFEARLKLVSESLPVIQSLNEMCEKQEIGPEECEMLRRGVLGGVKKFLESGCTIPEIEERRAVETRKLLAPTPKLLISPPAPPEDDTPEVPPVSVPPSAAGDESNLDVTELSDEERMLLKQLAQRMSNSESTD